jgi:hypothetical protein
MEKTSLNSVKYNNTTVNNNNKKKNKNNKWIRGRPWSALALRPHIDLLCINNNNNNNSIQFLFICVLLVTYALHLTSSYNRDWCFFDLGSLYDISNSKRARFKSPKLRGPYHTAVAIPCIDLRFTIMCAILTPTYRTSLRFVAVVQFGFGRLLSV